MSEEVWLVTTQAKTVTLCQTTELNRAKNLDDDRPTNEEEEPTYHQSSGLYERSLQWLQTDRCDIYQATAKSCLSKEGFYQRRQEENCSQQLEYCS